MYAYMKRDEDKRGAGRREREAPQPSHSNKHIALNFNLKTVKISKDGWV